MRKKIKKIAIVIPYYKVDLSKDEQVSINHLNKFLKNYDKFLILPYNMKTVSLKIPKIQLIKFPNEYFDSVEKYSELLTSKLFYEQFLNYEYILIYQMDALVFSDQLHKWCNQGYDYIGAPLFNSVIGHLSYNKGENITGANGGFSLRKVTSFIKVINIAEKLASRTSNKLYIRRLWFIKAVLMNQSHKNWLNAPPKDYPFNEDGFWSFEAVKYYPRFRVAPFGVALRFSFERFPKRCFKLNNYQLPFGCHAWSKYNRNFWSQYILQ